MKAGVQKHGRMISSAAQESKPINWERLTTVLVGIESIEYAVILGSVRDGIVHAGSDLDVAVSLADPDAQSADRLLEIGGTAGTAVLLMGETPMLRNGFRSRP